MAIVRLKTTTTAKQRKSAKSTAPRVRAPQRLRSQRGRRKYRAQRLRESFGRRKPAFSFWRVLATLWFDYQNRGV
jgi:hypothetical protein